MCIRKQVSGSRSQVSGIWYWVGFGGVIGYWLNEGIKYIQLKIGLIIVFLAWAFIIYYVELNLASDIIFI